MMAPQNDRPPANGRRPLYSYTRAMLTSQFLSLSHSPFLPSIPTSSSAEGNTNAWQYSPSTHQVICINTPGNHVSSAPTLAAVTPDANEISVLFLINIGNASLLAPLSQLPDSASSIVDWLVTLVLSFAHSILYKSPSFSG